MTMIPNDGGPRVAKPQPDTSLEPNPEQTKKIDMLALEAACVAAATPTFCNRFEILPSPVEGAAVFVIGGVTAMNGQADGGQVFDVAKAKFDGSYLVGRQLGLDITRALVKFFQIQANEIQG